jgi:hypothetical protein
VSNYKSPPATGRVQPGEDVQQKVRELIIERGETRAAAHIGVARQTATRICAGLPCNRSTVELVKLKLARINGDDND